MIADNPLLGPQWEALGHVLTSIFDRIRKHGDASFVMQTYGLKYQLSPNSSPFLQACINALGGVQLEVSANLQVMPELTPEQFKVLEFYGWTPPHDDPIEVGGDLEDENPNFSRHFAPDADSLDIAEFALTTLVGVYEIIEDDYFGFTGPGITEKVADLRKLGRLKRHEGNPDGQIFALPGKHLDQLEPSLPAGICLLQGPPRAKPPLATPED